MTRQSMFLAELDLPDMAQNANNKVMAILTPV